MKLPPWLHRLVLGLVVVAVLVVAALVAGGGADDAAVSTTATTATTAAATTERSAGESPTSAEAPTTSRAPTSKPPSTTEAPTTTKAPSSKTAATKTATTKTPTTKTPTTTVRSDSGLAVVPLSSLPDEASETWQLIVDGGPFPYDRDGITFQNREGLLPAKERGHYREYTVPTPGEDDRGARRLVVGGDRDVVFYTDDHYDSFVEVDVDR